MQANPEAFSIVSFLPRKDGAHSGDSSFQPHSIKRESDGEIFTIGDFVSNGTQMKGNITGFEMLNDNVFIQHTWSGVGMNLGSLSKVEPPSSPLNVNQIVYLKFRKNDESFTATIRGVHLYKDKVKYDLGLWLGDGSVDNPEIETRVYNVDSTYVTPA